MPSSVATIDLNLIICSIGCRSGSTVGTYARNLTAPCFSMIYFIEKKIEGVLFVFILLSLIYYVVGI